MTVLIEKPNGTTVRIPQAKWNHLRSRPRYAKWRESQFQAQPAVSTTVAIQKPNGRVVRMPLAKWEHCRRRPRYAGWRAILAQPEPASHKESPEASLQQLWVEQDGRWVPKDWLQPGYYADPPQFDPLPGESLSTPAFAARCFRAPPAAEKIDVVIPLSTGSRHGDAELRYALRSMCRHFENLGKVWVVGHRPAWLRNVEHIPATDDHSSKDVNIIRKLELACRAGVSDRFVFWSDDQVLLRPLAYSQLGPYTWSDLDAQRHWRNRWHRRLRDTRDWLAAHGMPTWHYDTHVPVPMERKKFLDLADRTREAWEGGDGQCVNTWYFNVASPGQSVTPSPLGDRKATIHTAISTGQTRSRVAGRWFLGFSDAGFTLDLQELLDELFPE